MVAKLHAPIDMHERESPHLLVVLICQLLLLALVVPAQLLCSFILCLFALLFCLLEGFMLVMYLLVEYLCEVCLSNLSGRDELAQALICTRIHAVVV